MFYVITDIRQFPGLDLVPEHGKELARIGTLVRHAAVEQLPIAHPDYPDIAITVSQLAGPTDDPRADWKNTVAMGTGDFSWDDPATWTEPWTAAPAARAPAPGWPSSTGRASYHSVKMIRSTRGFTVGDIWA